MKELTKRGINFVRNNPTVIYSLLLIFVVIGVLFLNSYFILTRFQENLDKTLRAKAVLAEDIIGVVGADYFADLTLNKGTLQEKINEIQKKDSEIAEVTIYSPVAENGKYVSMLSSGNSDLLGRSQDDSEKISQNAIKFAISVDDAFAFVSNVNGDRFWSVVKAVKLKDGSVGAVLLLKLSLADNDALVQKTIFQVYLLSIGAMVVVLLLIFNHIRLFEFAVRAKKLEEIDKMKDDFISMASHELKTPLTAIQGYTELLSDIISHEHKKGEVAVQQHKYLKNIGISADRLKALVEDLLDVSRIEQNRIPFEYEEVDLVKIINEVVSEMSGLASEKGLTMNLVVPEVLKVKTDVERLKQILINLVSNAIKYTEHGKVEIKATEDSKKAYLTVADTGMGISAENIGKLFSKFYRVQTPKTLQIAGTGLGLWIAREIAQKMGGDLKVESIVGVGSHFTVELLKK